MEVTPAELILENVGRSRRGKDGREVDILKGISLHARAGEILAIIGPSGGGKSTLVRLLNRLEDPSSGRILLAGRDIMEIDPLVLRRRVGLVPQKSFMFEGTVLDNLQFPFRVRSQPLPAGQSSLVTETLDLCRLDSDLLEREARSLSGGQQQRLSLARILISTPEVLLLDEPTSALDRPTADRLSATLKQICRARRLTIVLVTHDLRLAERTADRMAYLEAGRIVEEGFAGEMFAKPRSAAFQKFLASPEEERERH